MFCERYIVKAILPKICCKIYIVKDILWNIYCQSRNASRSFASLNVKAFLLKWRRGVQPQPVSLSVTPVSSLNFTPHVPLSSEFTPQLREIFLVNKSLGESWKSRWIYVCIHEVKESLSSYDWMVCCEGQIYSRGWSCGPSVEVIGWSLRGAGRAGKEGGKMGEVWRWIYLAGPLPLKAPLPLRAHVSLPGPPPLSPRRTPPSPASLHSIEADQRSKITLGRFPSKNFIIEFDQYF